MKALSTAIENKKIIFWTIVSVAVFVLGIYIVAVSQTVRNVAERQKIQNELSNLSVKIADMEFQAISLKNEVTLTSAKEAGFRVVENPKFVSRITSVAFASPQDTR